jgi:hypothetical protein
MRYLRTAVSDPRRNSPVIQRRTAGGYLAINIQTLHTFFNQSKIKWQKYC